MYTVMVKVSSQGFEVEFGSTQGIQGPTVHKFQHDAPRELTKSGMHRTQRVPNAKL